jgi:O-antigen ligase
LAVISFLLLITGAYEKAASFSPVIAKLYIPHGDAYLPLIVAGAMYGLLLGIRKKSVLRIILGLSLVMILFVSKTAGIFSFFAVAAYMIVFGRRSDLILTSSVSALLAAITLGILVAFGSNEATELLLENQHLETFGVGDSGGVHTSDTTDWRLFWWKTIYKDTMAADPLFGLGLGSDISSHFLQTLYNIDLSSEEAMNYSRYPHNVILTVFGRMGLMGLLVFMIFLVSLARLMIKTTQLQTHDTSDSGTTLLLAQLIAISGFANGLVQATYEVPYAAITHWFCIGYAMAYYQKHRIK